MKVFKAVGVCLLIEAAAVGLFWLAEEIAATRYVAAFGALLLLPGLALTFPDKKKERA